MIKYLKDYYISITYMSYFLFKYLLKKRKVNFSKEIKYSLQISFLLMLYKIILKFIKKVKFINYKISFFIFNLIIGFCIKKKISYRLKLLIIYLNLGKLFEIFNKYIIKKFKINQNLASKTLFNLIIFIKNVAVVYDSNLFSLYFIKYFNSIFINVRNQIELRNLLSIII